MTQGHLIAPVLAHIAPFTGLFDEDVDFMEPRPGSTTYGESQALPCQVETDEQDALQVAPNGLVLATRVHLVFRTRDVARVQHAPKPRDRLLALTTRRGKTIVRFDAANMRAIEARLLSFGLSRRHASANLLRVTFEGQAPPARRFV